MQEMDLGLASSSSRVVGPKKRRDSPRTALRTAAHRKRGSVMISLLSTPTAFEFRFESVSIGTRKSPLAIKQAELIAAAIELNTLGTTTTLVPLDSEGDQNLRRDVPLAQAGVDFTTLIDAAVLERVCDVGVHSLKDVPPTSRWNPGLVIACHLPRASPLDVLVGAESLAALPPNARVGTASVRRQAQLRAARPDLELVNVRGSVGSRLAQLDAGDVDALCLAAAGVARLGESAIAGRANGVLPPDVMLPGAGQGIICATCRVGADEMRLCAPLTIPTRMSPPPPSDRCSTRSTASRRGPADRPSGR